MDLIYLSKLWISHYIIDFKCQGYLFYNLLSMESWDLINIFKNYTKCITPIIF